MADYLLVSGEDPVDLVGTIDDAGRLQIVYASCSLADFRETLHVEHRDLIEPTGLVMIKVFDFSSGGHTWQMSVAHGSTSWARAANYAYYEFGPMSSPLEIDTKATSNATPPQCRSRRIWLKTKPTDGMPDMPARDYAISRPSASDPPAIVRMRVVRDDPPVLGGARDDDDLASLDSQTLFGRIHSLDTELDRLYEALLELASRPADRARVHDYIIRVLTHAATDSPRYQLCVRVAEEIRLDDTEGRRRLADALFMAAKRLDEIGASEALWSAIRRWASLVPTSELGELSIFLGPNNEGETIQCTLDALWHSLSVCEHPGDVLTPLAERAHELARKGLDPDWQIVPLASSISVCAALAFCVLSQDDGNVVALCQDMRAAQPHFPLDLLEIDIASALQHAEARDLPTLPRLQLVHAVLFFSR